MPVVFVAASKLPTPFATFTGIAPLIEQIADDVDKVRAVLS